MLFPTLALLTLLAADGAPPKAAAAEGAFAIRAARVHVGDGQIVEKAVVLIEDGRIRAVGRDVPVPKGAKLVEHDGDLSAGMIALHDYSGAQSENFESTRVMMPEAELRHAFDSDHADFSRLVAEGITSVVISASPGALVGGTTSVVKTSGGRVLKDRAQLHLSFSSPALQRNRYPTSYSSAVSELSARFADPRGTYAQARAGRIPVVIDAKEKHEIQRAIAFTKKFELRGVISGAHHGGELAESLKGAGLGVILGPFTMGMERRSLKAAVRLSEVGVPFGFGLDSPYRHAASLRMSAAALLREGLPRKNAWRALSSDAARLAGVDSKVGRIAAGLDADIVLWSGDPLDLGSKVVAVYVDGKLVQGEAK
jgi:imidazolonepropionase-like amidohydrolase